MRPCWLVLWLVGCAGSTSRIDPPEDCTDLTWEAFGWGYVHTWCTPCHSEEVPASERQGAPPGLDLDTWADVVASLDAVEASATGADAPMPPAGGVPTLDQERFAEWLQCGAPGEPLAPRRCAAPGRTAGDVQVDSEAAAQTLCADGDLVVAGDLDIQATEADITLDCLCEVNGSVTVVAAASLKAERLERIGGELSLTAPELTRVDLPELDDVDRDLSVSAPALPSLALGELARVGGVVSIEGELLSTLELPRLSAVGGDLRLGPLPTLADIESLTSVRTIGGDLRLLDLDAVVVVDRALWLLEEVGEVHLAGWDSLQVLKTDALTGPFEPRGIVLSSLPSLQRVAGFNRVQIVRGDLVVTDNPALTELAGFDNLARVTGDVVVTDNPQLTDGEIDAWLQPVEVDGEIVRADNGP